MVVYELKLQGTIFVVYKCGEYFRINGYNLDVNACIK